MIELRDAHRTVEVDGDTDIVTDDPELLSLLGVLAALRRASGVATFDVHRDAVDPAYFDYVWTTADGRAWTQRLRGGPASGSEEWSMNFDVPAFFALREFEGHRALRDATMRFLARGVTKIEVRWL